MDIEQLGAVVAGARARQDQILLTKGADYTRHEQDRLSNFKRSAAALGLTPIQVWAVFFNKHVDATMAFIKTGRVESESIEGRLDDIVNYAYLLEALIVEARGSEL